MTWQDVVNHKIDVKNRLLKKIKILEKTSNEQLVEIKKMKDEINVQNHNRETKMKEIENKLRCH